MSIVITGATGQLGRLVVADLLVAGVAPDDVTAIARSEEKAADLGVHVHVGDYDRPETLEGAFAPGDRVLLISGSEVGKRVPQHGAVIDAAKAAGVAQFVYTGAFGGPKADFALADEHRATEDLVLASGLPYTFLRNNWYTDIYTAGLADTIARGAVTNAVPPEGRIATASRADYAAATAVVLRTEGHLNAVYELSGDTAWTFGEFAAEVARQSGQPVAHNSVSAEENKKILFSAGLPDAYAGILTDVDAAIGRGLLAGTPGDLSRLIGRPTTPIADSIAAALAG
ncbi:SDR family oxidoreductase [Amycolatopsis saalfeldensis]|uniref:NAD(P)H dehydrogenase (Quinone) n=1 Tax=Amycolatopsis saalfeldensis TaxID=394193 RepID=A0A1H8QBL6_9PSEU|nr:SDR family oxidoreductase [Amycolatopsis saalfeldensis]SEO51173.1 NAD(P)H dehydrogenase (quinone) [Amycolatopsis saalfeldensis]